MRNNVLNAVMPAQAGIQDIINKKLDASLRWHDRNRGFTLLEILIALFIFSIVSAILVGALHSSMNAQEATEKNATHFRQMEMAWLMMSRDFEQIVNRPILGSDGTPQGALVGTGDHVDFTHAGYPNPYGEQLRSTWQRTRYYVRDESLYRESWFVLDRAANSSSHARRLLNNVDSLRLEYLDKDKKFQNAWPPESGAQDDLPLAIRVTIIFTDGNSMSQLYVIPTQIKIS